jgi:hypothetical protein
LIHHYLMIYNTYNMRIPKTFTIEDSLLCEVEQTRGDRSTSERVNELLKRGLEQEKRDNLAAEAAEFYAEEPESGRIEKRAFQKAALRSFARD